MTCRSSGLLGLAALLALGLAAGCEGDASTTQSEAGGGTGTAYAGRVVAYAPVFAEGVTEDDWPWFFAPELALGEPGDLLDVASLGYDPAGPDSLGGTLTLAFGTETEPLCGEAVSGDDLTVYENPFTTLVAEDETGVNVEVALVEVSEDGEAWYGFPPAIDESLPLHDPQRYGNVAGVTPTADGGDGFDLATLSDAPAGLRVCYVRLTDGGTRWEDYGNTQSDLYASGADIDAVDLTAPVAR